MFRRSACFFVLLLLLPPSGVVGQASVFIPLDDPVYHELTRAIDRGHLPELNPTARPYTYRQVLDAIDSSGHPDLANLRDRLAARAPSETGYGGSGRAGTRVTNHGLMDPLRHLEGSAGVYPQLEAGMHYQDGALIARGGFRGDTYWDQEPDGLDSVLRLYMRNDASYAGVMSRRGAVLIGRIGTQWGSSSALLLSNNPRPYDALHLRLGSGAWSFRSVIGELDSITGDGRFTGTAGDDSVRTGSEQRWMAAHRLDWRPSPNFQLSIQEAVLYSGAGAGLSLKYLNPAQFYILAVDNRPKNHENNGIVGLTVWAHRAPWTAEAQLYFDDFDLAFGTEPTSFAASARLLRALSPVWDVQGRVEAVASRTYNTFQPEGRWIYLNRGLGSHYSDYVLAEISGHRLATDRVLSLEPYVVSLWQGERDIRDPYRFGDSFDTILTGVVEQTTRAALRLRYQNRFHFSVDAGLNHTRNAKHVEGQTATRVLVTGEFGLRWYLFRPRGSE